MHYHVEDGFVLMLPCAQISTTVVMSRGCGLRAHVRCRSRLSGCDLSPSNQDACWATASDVGMIMNGEMVTMSLARLREQVESRGEDWKTWVKHREPAPELEPTHNEVEQVLFEAGLGDLFPMFEQEGVTSLDDLEILTGADFQEMGLNLVQRRRVIQTIESRRLNQYLHQQVAVTGIDDDDDTTTQAESHMGISDSDDDDDESVWDDEKYHRASRGEAKYGSADVDPLSGTTSDLTKLSFLRTVSRYRQDAISLLCVCSHLFLAHQTPLRHLPTVDTGPDDETPRRERAYKHRKPYDHARDQQGHQDHHTRRLRQRDVCDH